MKYVAVWLAGVATPFVVPWIVAVLHDYVYMPIIWEPRRRRKLRELRHLEWLRDTDGCGRR